MEEEEDYITYGTPLNQHIYQDSNKRYGANDKRALGSKAIYEQEVFTDGKQRLHGAFTGGYSAGYFNTVGSKEGFQPATYTSSRQARAGHVQRVEDFLDEDELEERHAITLTTRQEYDTFGAAAQMAARREEEHDDHQRIIPGPIPDFLLAPARESLGKRLLLRMGWRANKGVGLPTMTPTTGKWGKMAGIAPENTPLHLVTIKDNVHGLGYNPYADAEDVQQARKNAEYDSSDNKAGRKRERGVAFGTGIFDDEEEHMLHVAEDYTTRDAPPTADTHHFYLPEPGAASPKRRNAQSPHTPYLLENSESVDRQKYLAELDTQGTQTKLLSDGRVGGAKLSFIQGFVVGEEAVQQVRYAAPIVPDSWRPFSLVPLPKGGKAADLQNSIGSTNVPVEPPADAALQRRIELLAVQVARSGAAAERLAQKRYFSDPTHQFLFQGEGAAYYQHKLAHFKGAYKSVGARSKPSPATRSVLTPDERAGILQIEQLPSSQQQKADGAAAAARAEDGRRLLTQTGIAEEHKKKLGEALSSQFVKKDVYDASQLVTASGLVSAADLPKAPEPPPAPKVWSLPAPRRSFLEWRPSPLLCKRFDVADPYKQRAPPVERRDFPKLDQMLGDAGVEKAAQQEPVPPPPLPPPPILPDQPQWDAERAVGAPESKPLDLFKAIFEDSDSDEGDEATLADQLPPPPAPPQGNAGGQQGGTHDAEDMEAFLEAFRPEDEPAGSVPPATEQYTEPRSQGAARHQQDDQEAAAQKLHPKRPPAMASEPEATKPPPGQRDGHVQAVARGARGNGGRADLRFRTKALLGLQEGGQSAGRGRGSWREAFDHDSGMEELLAAQAEPEPPKQHEHVALQGALLGRGGRQTDQRAQRASQGGEAKARSSLHTRTAVGDQADLSHLPAARVKLASTPPPPPGWNAQQVRQYLPPQASLLMQQGQRPQPSHPYPLPPGQKLKGKELADVQMETADQPLRPNERPARKKGVGGSKLELNQLQAGLEQGELQGSLLAGKPVRSFEEQEEGSSSSQPSSGLSGSLLGGGRGTASGDDLQQQVAAQLQRELAGRIKGPSRAVTGSGEGAGRNGQIPQAARKELHEGSGSDSETRQRRQMDNIQAELEQRMVGQGSSSDGTQSDESSGHAARKDVPAAGQQMTDRNKQSRKKGKKRREKRKRREHVSQMREALADRVKELLKDKQSLQQLSHEQLQQMLKQLRKHRKERARQKDKKKRKKGKKSKKRRS